MTRLAEKKYVSDKTELSSVSIDGEVFFKISNVDKLRPFFMSIVSDSNHWMFISSNGGLSAGRKNSEYALFPYYTDDKITESTEVTGSKSIFRISKGDKTYVWEPYGMRCEGQYKTTRNLYKNKYGNKVMFEEINHDLEMTYRYQWSNSNKYGFVRKTSIKNSGDEQVSITLLDGVQNILPYGVESYTQNQSSNLVDAYKRSELVTETGIGIFALSAIIVDKAEPSEALKANVIWSTGLEKADYLLSSLQVNNFRKGQEVTQEEDVKAEKGAYFLSSDLVLAPGEQEKWMIVANVNQSQSDIVSLSDTLQKKSSIGSLVQENIDLGTKRLVEINASSDALQMTADPLKDARHFSNTLFNIMRGGIFDHGYQIEKWDFKNYLHNANHVLAGQHRPLVDQMPEKFDLNALRELVEKAKDPHFTRLSYEYLPLKFSRRHGDPSRPWNRFSINTRSEIDGSKILDYEGNWRDIFQNWEALSLSYPYFLESMMHKFLNASTFDGYNPYRVTKSGFDWEVIEPDDPWSYIGYWGDHQIIYLLKFLELIEKHFPGNLLSYLDQNIFVYAHVPYRIKDYKDILADPKDTILFDEKADAEIRLKREKLGADGALLRNVNDSIHRVNFLEKILATLLAKVANFIPEGGIWMNTQRPEWNDANNALVGNGVSMVTLYYLRRFLQFFIQILDKVSEKEVLLSEELYTFYQEVAQVLEKYQEVLNRAISDEDRKAVQDGLGQAASKYRVHIYNESFSGAKQAITLTQFKDLLVLCNHYLDHSIGSNRRFDGLYHAYNLVSISDQKMSISHLSEMLEGQVAVLSSGYLSGEEALQVLDSLKASALFREDQYSYILYPNKNLPGFMDKNNIPSDRVAQSNLLTKMVSSGDRRIIEKDALGNYHFNGNFRNARDLRVALDSLSQTDYQDLIVKEKDTILNIFEEVFNHKAFTGRSGTFFGYEGLGSIYWHMVSKLLLATQESCIKAIEQDESEETIGRLLEHYYEINEGIGVHKPPSLYGAFPTDPYSHTPMTKGAQQPGMTGQVKEDILCRFGELGVFVQDGKLRFDPCLLRKKEFVTSSQTYRYINIHGSEEEILLTPGTLAFSYCQVPVIYQISDNFAIEVKDRDNQIKRIEAKTLSQDLSGKIFSRSGDVTLVKVFVNSNVLR